MTDTDRILIMASLIAAVRTSRFEDREFQGMSSPRVMAQISHSLWLARKIQERALARAADEAWEEKPPVAPG